MSINGKRDGFTVTDLKHTASVAGLKQGATRRILADVTAILERWPQFAAAADIDAETIDRIAPALRLHLPTH